MDKDQVAKMIAGTLTWAARQADNPTLVDFGRTGVDVICRVNLPGPTQLFRLTVTEVEQS